MEDRADAPDKDDLVEQVDVPDTKDCEWDEITDKFSKARDNSQAKNEYLTITSATTTAAIDPTHYQCAKFFEFKNREWVDRGIGHCQIELLGDEAQITILPEASHKLLATKISRNIFYRMLDDRLIVWTKSDGTNMGLSFLKKNVAERYSNLSVITRLTCGTKSAFPSASAV